MNRKGNTWPITAAAAALMAALASVVAAGIPVHGECRVVIPAPGRTAPAGDTGAVHVFVGRRFAW